MTCPRLPHGPSEFDEGPPAHSEAGSSLTCAKHTVMWRTCQASKIRRLTRPWNRGLEKRETLGHPRRGLLNPATCCSFLRNPLKSAFCENLRRVALETIWQSASAGRCDLYDRAGADPGCSRRQRSGKDNPASLLQWRGDWFGQHLVRRRKVYQGKHEPAPTDRIPSRFSDCFSALYSSASHWDGFTAVRNGRSDCRVACPGIVTRLRYFALG